MNLACLFGWEHDWEESLDAEDGRPAADLTFLTGMSVTEAYRMHRECRRCGKRQRGVAWRPSDTWRYGTDVKMEWH